MFSDHVPTARKQQAIHKFICSPFDREKLYSQFERSGSELDAQVYGQYPNRTAVDCLYASMVKIKQSRVV